MSGVLTGDRRGEKRERRPYVDRGRDWSDAATRKPAEVEEARKDSPLEPPEGEQPYQYLDFGLPAPELWEDTFLLFEVTRFVGIRESSLRNYFPFLALGMA